MFQQGRELLWWYVEEVGGLSKASALWGGVPVAVRLRGCQRTVMHCAGLV
ncbi:hypothetical protein GCM10010293_53940 [Streptomyces griseoflavus]|nr:hypothetical protein GCM10010293_53940 [Streptomyces griseoflavus]